MPTLSMALEVQFSPGVWTDIITDTIASEGMSLSYGIFGNKPWDVVAGAGEFKFTLNNMANNSGGLQGYYSPNHANKRSGWGFNILVRLRCTYGTTRTRFIGYIYNIDVIPGKYGSQKVEVTAYDLMRNIVETPLREIALQVNKTDEELIEAVIAAFTAATGLAPVSTDIDAGIDTYPYCFDSYSEDGISGGSLFQEVVSSGLAFLAIKGNGTLIYRNRSSRALGSSVQTFNDTMHGFTVSSSPVDRYDRVRCTMNPRTVSPAATESLFTTPSNSPLGVSAGDTIEVWTEWADPNDRKVHVGGYQVVTALVANTHYFANQQEDMLGVDLSGSVSVTLEPFANTGKWTITNNGSIFVFVLLTAIGRVVRDPGHQTFESGSGGLHLILNLPYQDDHNVTKSIADYLLSVYSGVTSQILNLEFMAFPNLIDAALDLEVFDVITITETMTGIAAVMARINSINIEISVGYSMKVSLGLIPKSVSAPAWLWGVVGNSEWGETTYYAF